MEQTARENPLSLSPFRRENALPDTPTQRDPWPLYTISTTQGLFFTSRAPLLLLTPLGLFVGRSRWRRERGGLFSSLRKGPRRLLAREALTRQWGWSGPRASKVTPQGLANYIAAVTSAAGLQGGRNTGLEILFRRGDIDVVISPQIASRTRDLTPLRRVTSPQNTRHRLRSLMWDDDKKSVEKVPDIKNIKRVCKYDIIKFCRNKTF